MSVQYTDRSVWQHGTHKGKTFANIPAIWFLYMAGLPNFDATGPLGRYITENKQALEVQAKQQVRTDKQLKR
jgi:hypothetical protein